MTIGLVQRKNRTGSYFTLPVSLFLLAFIIFPLLTNVKLSLTNPSGDFDGIRQFTRTFSDPTFWKSFRITIFYVFGSVVLQVSLGTAVGIALNQKFRGRGLVRSVILIPWVIPGAVAATTWAWMYHGDFGILSRIISSLGLTEMGQGLLILPGAVVPALIAVNVWKMFPFVAIMVLAGLQSIDTNLYEAARVDGANPFQEFINITIPGLRHVLITVLLLLTIWGFNGITLIYTMTQGGPADLSLTLPLFIYRTGFLFFRFNEAATQSIFMFLILSILIGIYLKVFASGSPGDQ